MSNVTKSMMRIDQELCTGCRRCHEVCPVNAIEGIQGMPQQINSEKCVNCGQCVQVCSVYASEFDEELTPRAEKLRQRGLLGSIKEPLFAAYNQGQVLEAQQRLADSNLYKMVQCAPAVRTAIGEEFGMPLGSLTPGKMAAALRKLGFDRIYDTNFAADLTIMEEGSELVERITQGGVLPMFTSCCPAWVKFVEQEYPELIPNLSSCKSPQQMAGAMFKTYGAKIDGIGAAQIYSVAIMPCTCKQFEAERLEMADSGYRDVDIVLTTRELAYLIKAAGIDFQTLPEENFDKPMGTYTGAGNIFGATGGVMEAAVRTGYELITKEGIGNVDLEFIRGSEGVRKASVVVGDVTLELMVVAGLAHVIPILEAVKGGAADFHFMEVMTCPAGCISGGGQPKILLPEEQGNGIASRKASMYKHDKELTLRKSHENPEIKKIYKNFLGQPLGHESHHLLHTTYQARR